MRYYYTQILCKNGFTGDWFIEEGLLEDHFEYLVYRDLVQGYGEFYRNFDDFKKSMVHDLKDFKKYCSLVELA
jgi:hypothetical protein